MWLNHRWTWTNFKAYLDLAKTRYQFTSSDYKLLSGMPTESLIGFTAAQGGNFVDPATNNLTWTSSKALGIAGDLKTMFSKGYIDSETKDISTSFKNGKALFSTGSLWFLGDDQYFSYSLPFSIGAVPYPVADGDAQTLATYKIPVYGSDAFAVANVQNGLNGLNSKILFNILDDLQRGLTLDYGLTQDEMYEMWLQTKFDSMYYVDAVMSVRDPKYQYYEKIFTASMTVGGGSQFGPNAMYNVLNGIITRPERNPLTELEAIRRYYETVLENLK
jgi:hypothetical protein